MVLIKHDSRWELLVMIIKKKEFNSLHCTASLFQFCLVTPAPPGYTVFWSRNSGMVSHSNQKTTCFFYLFTIVLLFIWTKLYFVTLKRRTAPTMPNLLSRLRSYATVVPVSFLCSTGYFTDAVDSRDKRASIRSCFIRTWWQPDYETLAVMELVVISRE